MGAFSAHYNFYFELCKRLKQKMKESRKHMKFRKVYLRSRSAGQGKQEKGKGTKTTTKKIVRKK